MHVSFPSSEELETIIPASQWLENAPADDTSSGSEGSLQSLFDQTSNWNSTGDFDNPLVDMYHRDNDSRVLFESTRNMQERPFGASDVTFTDSGPRVDVRAGLSNKGGFDKSDQRAIGNGSEKWWMYRAKTVLPSLIRPKKDEVNEDGAELYMGAAQNASLTLSTRSSGESKERGPLKESNGSQDRNSIA